MHAFVAAAQATNGINIEGKGSTFVSRCHDLRVLLFKFCSPIFLHRSRFCSPSFATKNALAVRCAAADRTAAQLRRDITHLRVHGAAATSSSDTGREHGLGHSSARRRSPLRSSSRKSSPRRTSPVRASPARSSPARSIPSAVSSAHSSPARGASTLRTPPTPARPRAFRR